MSLYKHFVIENPIEKHLDRLAILGEEKQALLDLTEEIFHHRLFAVILDLLPETRKKEFVNIVDSQNYLATFDYLKERIDHVEVVIDTLLKEVHEEIISDIEELAQEEHELT